MYYNCEVFSFDQSGKKCAFPLYIPFEQTVKSPVEVVSLPRPDLRISSSSSLVYRSALSYYSDCAEVGTCQLRSHPIIQTSGGIAGN